MLPSETRMSPHPWAEPGELRPGITVAGYLRGELGMGEVARSALTAVEAAGIEHAAVVVNRTYSRQDHPLELTEGPYDLDTAIAAINADQVTMFQGAVGPGFFNGRRTVGCGLGSSNSSPKRWRTPLRSSTRSGPSAPSLPLDKEQIDKPVHVFPLAVASPGNVGRCLEAVPSERFVFLFTFDFFSVFERKNPLAVMEAFSKAFATARRDRCWS